MDLNSIDSLCKDAHVKYTYESGKIGFKFILFRRSDEKNVTVNKTEQAVFALLSEHPEYTRDELAEKTSKTVRTIQRTVDSLREKGLIERIGSDKTGQWKIIEQEVQ